jgi:hypothetical protein
VTDPTITPDLVVTPEPTDEELAAIVAAVQVLLVQDRQVRAAGPDRNGRQPTSGQSSRWGRAGRREAMAGLPERDRSV